MPEVQPIPVTIHNEQLPLFWEHSSLFFANIHALFYGNDQATRFLDDRVDGLSWYGSRMLGILNLLFRGPNNLLLLEVAPDAQLIEYLTELDLHLPEYAILPQQKYESLLKTLDGDIAAKKNHFLYQQPATCVDGFVTDSNLKKIAEKLDKKTASTLEGSRKGNNKFLLHHHLQRQGLAVFDTEIAESAHGIQPSLEKLRRRGFDKAVVKAQVGASGCGSMVLPTHNGQNDPVPDYFFYEGPCLVQGWIDANHPDVAWQCSPSVQMFTGENHAFLYDMTEQILSDQSVHEGNLAPPPTLKNLPEIQTQLLDQSTMAVRWLHEQGYRGTASVDFLVFERREKIEVILCEINARVTGATYPAMLAKHFNPTGAWLSRNILFRKAVPAKELMKRLHQNGFLYKPRQERGILPYNFIHDQTRQVLKGQFVCLAATTDDCLELLKQVVETLPVEADFDRD